MQLIFSEHAQIGEVRDSAAEYQVAMQTKAHYDGGLKVLVVDITITLSHPDLRGDSQSLLDIPSENRVLETHAYSALAVRRTVNLADNMIRRVREAVEKRRQLRDEQFVRDTRARVEKTVREATPSSEAQTT